MRKITKLLLTIFLFTLSISIVKANTIIEKERTEDNNYGVNKKWEITSKNKSNVLDTPYVDSNLKVYDYQDSLTDEEIRQTVEKFHPT